MGLLGVQTPRLSSIPAGDTARGEQAVQFARWCGMTLYPWQEELLRDMCRTTPDGNWAAREVVTVVPRQNGKGEVLVARELAGIFLFGERMIFHSAHFMDTAIDAQKRLWEVIEHSDDLLEWFSDPVQSPDGRAHSGVPRQTTGNGKESVQFPNGAQVLFRTRTKKTGRGLSVDLLLLDECFDLPHETAAALTKTIRAKERAQSVYISSPVNRFEHMHGAVFSAKRWSGIDGAEQVLFKEWSPAEDADPFVQSTWAACNPSMVDSGFGAQLSDIRADAQSAATSELLKQAFMVETLGAGNWVPRDGDGDQEFVVDPEVWGRLHDPAPVVVGDCSLAVDASPDGLAAGLVSAVRTERGVHLMLSEHDRFNREVLVAAIGQAVKKNDPLDVYLDTKGPAATLIKMLSDRGVEPVEMTWKSVSRALELMLQLVEEGRLTHDGDPRWLDALRAAGFRPGSGSGRALTSATGGPICALVAASFALWGLVESESPGAVPDVKRKTKFVGQAVPVGAPVPAALSMSF